MIFNSSRRIITGIDIGTHHVKVVVAEHDSHSSRGFPTILGTGSAQSKGLRHGYIINTGEVTRSLRTAVAQAQKAAKVPIKKAYLSIGGVGLDEMRSVGETIISRADLEISDTDIERAITNSEEKVTQKLLNRKVIHVIPLSYRIDGTEVLGRPQSMKGTRLEVETLFVTALEQHLHDLISVVENSGIAVVDVMASPVAASFVTLTKAQKIAGCVLANIGAETISTVIFENGIPISLKVFPTGSTDITNDIALGFKVSLEEAEQIKLGALTDAQVSKKRLDEIISNRLSDMFELIEAHLKKISKSGLLPAGIVITGGGSGIATIEDPARVTLRLPSKITSVAGFSTGPSKIKDASWAVAYGLCVWGVSADDESVGISIEATRTGLEALGGWFKQFLP